MSVGRLIGGILCLVVAVFLAVLSVVLPEGNVVFMVDGQNLPIIPVIVLAGAGLMLLMGAWAPGTKRSR